MTNISNCNDIKIKLSGVDKQAPSSSTKDLVAGQRGKNLDQYTVDNPPTKAAGVFFITEFLYIGNQKTAYDHLFLKNNQVSHIVNLSGDSMHNIFDPQVTGQLKQQELNILNCGIMGKIKYFTVSSWDEYKLPLLRDIELVMQIYCFIEDAVKNYKSCLVTSTENKCKTAVIATVYLMFKYKWSLHKSFEFLNSRK